jgi:hypothetical protein
MAFQPDTKSLPNPYEFNSRQYQDDRAKGFGVAIKLIKRAEDEKASPATIAKLRYEAAKLKRFMALNQRDESKKDFSPSIKILRGVTRKPDRFLVDKDSAAWFRNCVSLLVAVYGDQGDAEQIKKELKDTVQAVTDSPNLDAELKFRTICSIRMAGSDAALGVEDWEAAIAWVQPVIDSADQFMNNEDAYQIAMAVRQQSMFLFKNDQPDDSAELIDSMCKRLDEAKEMDEHLRLAMQCMLRGKHLVNFDPGSVGDPFNPTPLSSDDVLLKTGWENYHELSKRVVDYQGEGKDTLLYWYTNMRRLANFVLDDPDEAIKNVRHTMEQIRNEPLVHSKDSGVWSNLMDMHSATEGILNNNRDPRTRDFKKEVSDFVEEFRK